MTELEVFMQRLTLQGIRLWPQDGKLRYAGPQHRITPDLLNQLRKHKSVLLQRLSKPVYAPVSDGQHGLWFIHQSSPDNSAYNMSVAYRIHSALDVDLLRSTIQLLVNRHASLRTRFMMQDEVLVQQIDGYQKAAIETVDATDWSDSSLSQQVQAFHERPFDLSEGPLFRAMIWRHAGIANHTDNRLSIALSFHHIIVDGWSAYQLVDELFTLYTTLKRGAVAQLPFLEHTYIDYVSWQRSLLETDGERLWSYWQNQLEGELPILQLPTDYPRPPQQVLRGISQPIHLSTTLTEKLKQVALQNGCTLYTVLLAAYQLLLARLSGQDDILVGLAMAGQSRPEFSEVIGHFVSIVVARADLCETPTFVEFLTRIKNKVFSALDHQDYPFGRLVKQLNPQRDPSRSAIYQASFVLQKPHRTPELFLQSNKSEHLGLVLEPIPIVLFEGQEDIALDLMETPAGIVGHLKGNAGLFTNATLERMANHFEVLLNSIVSHPDQPVLQLPMLTEAEYHQILVEWNNTATDYPKDKCIHQLFEEQVERTPDAIALVVGENQLTYSELNARANQLARYLQSLGKFLEPGTETRIGIYMERSLDMVVGVLAILKAGGTYVPLDTAYPPERLTYMTEDSQAALLLTQAKLLGQFACNSVQTVCLDETWPLIAQQHSENLGHPIQSNCLAYVIYTSGSTGQPKGVMIEHQSLTEHILNVGGVYEITPQDRILQFSAFSFDAAQEQIFEALCHGATLVLREDELWMGEEFNRRVVEHRITLVELTPTYFHSLIGIWLQERSDFLDGELRLIQVSSEPIMPETVRQWQQLRPSTRLLNIYGPTEATVTATSFELTNYQPDSWPANMPIGRPFPGRKAYILDKHLQPVPIGVYGELYMGGDGVGRGYLNRPALTAECFIDNPFVSSKQPEKLYKTGDVVRWLPDLEGPPNIEFIGRVDNQVKIRGYRVELGEIEYALAQHPQIDYPLVLVREEAVGDKRLVAYVVAKEQRGTEAEWQDAPETLRDYLRQKLPNYMIPNAFVLLDHFPLTSNGKIDRKALPAPGMSALATSSEFVPPQTPTEKILASLFGSILHVDQVGIYDNFFDLGGHSLLLTQLYFKLKKIFKISFFLSDLFTMPTVTKLATTIDAAPKSTLAKHGGSQINQTVDLRAEAILDPTIRPGQTIPYQTLGWEESMRTSSVLITGATGFLGAFLLHELLQQTPATIRCLVRSVSEQEGMVRLQNNLKQYGLWQEAYTARIIPIPGDLSEPLFGLESNQFYDLAARVDAIYHNGALVSLIQPYETLKPVNVLGTQEVIRLAAMGGSPTPIHYVSTLSIFDDPAYFDGRCIYEYSDLGNGSGLLDGYAQSKWVAEKLVIEAQNRGIPATIYRPGIISGQSQTGAWNMNDWFPLYLKAWVQLAAWPQTESTVYLAPVDYVSAAIVALSHQSASQNRIFHLENPDALQYRQLAEWLCTFGYPLQETPIEQWLSELTQAVSHSAEDVLMPLLPMFITPHSATDQPSMADLFRNSQLPPVFDCSNTLAALAHTEISCPQIDAKQFRTYLSYFIETGFLEAPGDKRAVAYDN